ncbi:hypothetical protein CLOBY_27360 [Clostridium saccharobutylicum]|uniref:hypothetical protein n=1 Tax=Clostridium saccharobutylicum TaxID=169679 RepID=UPI000983C047|nr:hypothetical protein [Clostridium saccharobutylicum]AQS10591.1 hypothetical protein CLOBY_27360 [Clostridium saccharobutylicum]MBC2438056.1 hypothetical protein [Clostridium saccharobutylicum]NSB90491.1 hypothetical protein [Clostridium saccharobutylicum]NYC31546.1 hypothetical protein [Clostridium saccharobutylicum]OOM18864.1 hypothetical protein CLSAB_03220 [Clostridium saccharobutylicum]
MESLNDLKKKYNALLDRNSKAEAYLNTHSWLEYETPLKNKDGTYMTKDDGNGNPMYISAHTMFDDLVVDLSQTKKHIETLLYRNMTDDEIWNGFKV